jgi:hypothetical protein
LFEFYPPLVSYLGLAFYGIGFGFIQAAKASLTLSILLGGLGVYVFARDLFGSRAAAWLSAVAYLSAPYLMTDVYERGAAAETLALAILPWLFWSLRSLLYRQTRWHWWLSAGLVAGMMLAHNGTALFFVPAACAYVALLALWDRQWRALATVVLAVVLGLGLSAFYWLPAVAEIKFTRAEQYMLGAKTDVTQNLLAWRDLIQPTWVFAYVGETRFHFARLLALLGLAGLLALPLQKPGLRSEVGLLALCWLVVMLLQLESALYFWQHMPLVRFIQFAWRLYGLASFCVALLAGSLVAWPQRFAPMRWPLAVTIGLFCIGVSIPNLRPDLLPLWEDIDEAGINKLDLFERGRKGYALFSDYSPIDMQTTSGGLTMPRPDGVAPTPPLSAAPSVRVIAENPVLMRFAVAAPAPFPLRVQRIFFPGWQVYVDGQKVETYASGQLGLVSADLPAGTYEVAVQFDQTPIRRTADGIAMLCLAVWCALLIAWSRPRQIWLARGGLMLLVILALVYWQTRPKPARMPVAVPANFQDQLHLLGYDLAQSSWQPGEEIELRLYWLTQQTPPANYKIFLHVAELDDSGKVAQADSEPMLGYTPMTVWDSGEVVVDEHRLQLEETVKPGRYQLLIGVYHPETVQNLSVRSAPTVWPGDRIVLAEVEIGNE